MVDEVLQNKDTDFIYFDCVHNYPHFHNKSSYGYLKAELKICFIDMGCVVVRSILAKKVGFNHVHHTADWKYFEEILAQQPNIKRIGDILPALKDGASLMPPWRHLASHARDGVEPLHFKT